MAPSQVVPLPIFEPMLATTGRLPVDADAWAAEPKLDGWRAMLYADGDRVAILTRSRRNVASTVPAVCAAGAALPLGTVLDGELVAGGGRPWDFYRLSRSMWQRPGNRSGPVAFVAFDILCVDSDPVADRPYEERRALLDSLGFTGPAWHTTTSFAGCPDVVFNVVAGMGLEGVMLKRLDSHYEPGRRSAAWVKVKTVEWRSEHLTRRFRTAAGPPHLLHQARQVAGDGDVR